MSTLPGWMPTLLSGLFLSRSKWSRSAAVPAMYMTCGEARQGTLVSQYWALRRSGVGYRAWGMACAGAGWWVAWRTMQHACSMLQCTC